MKSGILVSTWMDTEEDDSEFCIILNNEKTYWHYFIGAKYQGRVPVKPSTPEEEYTWVAPIEMGEGLK